MKIPKEYWPHVIKGLQEGNTALIAKPNEWFDEGTEVEFIGAFMETYDLDGSFSPSGLFRGLKNNSLDEEICSFDEFVLVRKNNG